MENELSRRDFIAKSVAAAAAAGAAGAMGVAPAFAVEEMNSGMDPAVLNAWLKDHRNFGASYAFLPGEENAPTDEEMVEILKIANSYMWCHMLTAPHFVVVRDPEEQAAISPVMGTTPEDATGTLTILVMADGCKDQEYHKDAYTARHDDTHYWQMYYSLIETGQAHAYLNMAARSYGYRVLNIGAISVPSISYEEGLGDQEAIPEWSCGGCWDMIRKDNWDISRYCHGKDDETPFTHHVLAGDRTIDLDGNLTLLYIMKIGTIDEDAIGSQVTSFGPSYCYTDYPHDGTLQQYNFDFWDSGAQGMDFYEPDPRFVEENEKYQAEQEDGKDESK